MRKFALAYLIVLVFFAWGLLAQRYAVFPHAVFDSFLSEVEAYVTGSEKDLVSLVTEAHQEQPNQFGFQGLKVADPDFDEDGYLLVSRYSGTHRQVVVELFDIRANQVLHTWVPDLEAIFALTPKHTGGVNTRMAYRSQHPLPMPNGDLIIGSGEGPLVRINPCGEPVWAIDRHFHHSIEKDAAGVIVAPIVVQHGRNEDGILIRDDGVALVSADGELLAEYGLTELLLKNGYRGLVYGVGPVEEDRYHLNDAQPLLGREAKEGLLLSIRQLSSVALLRPSSGTIDWLQTGPWLNQHDIDDLGDGRFSIFGNELMRGEPELFGHSDILGEHSEIYIYRPDDDRVETPYTDILQRVDMRSRTEGRVTILNNGDAFIEETNRQRLLRVSRDALRWEYVAPLSTNTAGALHWSRYLPRQLVFDYGLETVRCERDSA